MSDSRSLRFVIGNTYQRLSPRNAPFDRSGRYRKVHDWTVYLDVIGGDDADIIEFVKFDMNNSTFKPQAFVCTCPIKVLDKDGLSVWRFSSRQQTYAQIGPIKTIIRGRGGTYHAVEYELVFSQRGGSLPPYSFIESRRLKDFKPSKMWDNKFGIELELTSSAAVTLDDVANGVSSRAGVTVDALTYSEGRQTTGTWKLVPDSSIVCSQSQPDCTRFELVSPILRGGEGLNTCYKVMEQGLTSVAGVKVNRSMGFHVHINVEDLSLESLIKVCQNFVKYEDAMDSFMPPSRRTGSDESNQYFRSNKFDIGPNLSNKQRHEMLAQCTSLEELCVMMNPQGRYYKLNLQNLMSRRQPTLEFRQHSATASYAKLKNWVRFCMAMVANSAKLRSPSCLKDSTPLDDQFEKLFYFVIKDRFLRNYYLSRRSEVNSVGALVGSCCDSCDHGNICAFGASSQKRTWGSVHS
mmetsp:Transcript_10368/g.15401  ORF Transcript_10368/g.15401 Transcript_10368/m.15401 type:complete len:464 (-) Transcript_10368:138-1529(-)